MDYGKISIIMGVYNCEKTLAEAIESILAQTYNNWELIMCDDCSTDGTYNVTKKFAEKFPKRIKILKNEVNSRLAFSLNHCLQYATGEFIARMDGDDKSLPDRLEKQIQYLRENPDIDLVGTAMQRFNEKELADIVKSINHPNYYTLHNAIPFHHATILARREVFEQLNGYTVSKRTNRAQDYDLWFRFYHAGFRGENLQEALYLVREDEAAIRRRTAKVRLYGLQTTWIGFKLLGYPWYWLIKPTLITFLKVLTPYKAVDLLRKLQKAKWEKAVAKKVNDANKREAK